MCQPKPNNRKEQIFNRRQIARDVKRLSKPNNLRAAFAIVSEYLILALTFTCAIWLNHWISYVLAAVVVASRQHAMGVLFHDASHSRLFTSRKLNNLVSDIFLAFPLGVSTSVYRHYHRAHHRFVNDVQDDPDRACVHDDKDWEWPKSKMAGIMLFVRDLLGLNVVGHAKLTWARWSPWPHMIPFLMKNSNCKPSAKEKLTLIVWTAIVGSLVVWTNAWFYIIVLWVLPATTFLTAIFRLRAIAEHYGVEESNELQQSRTVIVSWWERFFLSPYNVNYHIEHHLFPSVPCYRLGQLHERLMEDEVYAQKAHLTYGYLNVLSELLCSSRETNEGCDDKLQKSSSDSKDSRLWSSLGTHDWPAINSLRR